MARVQELTERLERLPDPAAREAADELVSSILELYGEGLERIFSAIAEAGDAGAELSGRLQEDGLVASLMLIHDLYPVPLEDRVDGGTRERAPVHGEPRRQRRAAGDEGRHRAHLAGGELQDLPRLHLDA